MTVSQDKCPRVWAISGKAQAGKDTFAIALRDQLNELGIQAQIYKFAQRLKQIHASLYGHSLADYEDSLFKNLKLEGHPLTVREELIDIGQVFRGYYIDTWVAATVKDIQEDFKLSSICEHKVAIISDLRFPNEVAYLRKHFVASSPVLVRVNAPHELKIENKSETSLDNFKDWDMVWTNDQGNPYSAKRAAQIHIIKMLQEFGVI